MCVARKGVGKRGRRPKAAKCVSTFLYADQSLAVEVGGAVDLPRVRDATQRTLADTGRTFDEPYEHLPRRRLEPPEDVGATVAVEVADAGDLPDLSDTARRPLTDYD